MQHRRKHRQLSRDYNQRKALLRTLSCSIINHERIETTVTKAKEIQPVVDKMIGLGLDGSLSARRRALAFLNSRDIVAKLFDDIAKRYDSNTGGYTRIFKTRIRKGDGATLAIIELTKIEHKDPEEGLDVKTEAKKEKAAVSK